MSQPPTYFQLGCRQQSVPLRISPLPTTVRPLKPGNCAVRRVRVSSSDSEYVPSDILYASLVALDKFHSFSVLPYLQRLNLSLVSLRTFESFLFHQWVSRAFLIFEGRQLCSYAVMMADKNWSAALLRSSTFLGNSTPSFFCSGFWPVWGQNTRVIPVRTLSACGQIGRVHLKPSTS